MSGFCENQNGSGHAGVGLEHAGRHGDHGLQPVAVHQLLADSLVRGGRTEQHAVGDDTGTAPADAQHPQEQGQKQQLGFLGLADLQQIRRHGIGIQTAFEWRVGKNQRVFLLVRILVGQAVPILDKGTHNAVGHHVHRADPEHGAIHVVAEEHMVHIMVFLLAVEEDFFFPGFFQILARRNKKTGGAAGRVADHIVRPGGHHIHHHADDVPGGAELAVNPGGGDFGQEVFVDVAPDIGVVELLRLGVDLVHGGDDLVQHQRRGDLENGVPHILGVGTVLVGVEVLDEGEHPLLHDGIHLSGGKIVEH